ncbi:MULTISPECIES: acyl-CoA dehydrogenase family protein [Bacillaceae]|uniref:acyl-CoA dehydrogenase family protein n=1 Tax=Bacillaceae TaxID=186817 RepID=UPI000BEBDCE9|nr:MULTISPECIES: acyl-CoA dehydrogenase family protein [unclassified Bacillus (in: firmicutes)]PEC50158.1 acyl-CoA dehydrogenase [Bacillus sp. AFS096315]PFM76133.1 acyl-CoA dehydrogenase [Bacillus sp. AFS077874]PGZ92938.1 acyl-CoA dehydrogenase [Bacillus sp. AFS029533]
MAKVLSESKNSSRSFLNEEHHIFRQAFVKFLEKEAIPFVDLWEEDHLVPLSFWRKAGENGFLCPWVDEKYGGLNADFGYSIVMAEELIKIGLGASTAIGLHNDIVMPYIQSYGNEEQKKRWLPGAVTGEYMSSVAMTEPGTGSDLSGIKTTAVRKGDHFVINGEKTFISSGILTNLIVVAVKTDPKAVPGHKGISLIVVEEGTPGFKRGKKLNKVGLHSQDTAELIFEDAIVPVENLLGEENKGFYYLMEKLQQERLMCSITAVYSAKRILDITMDYVKERKVFGKPVGSFQNTQFKLAELATEITIGKTFLDDLIVKHIAKENVVTEVSMAKWWTTALAKKAASECLQLHGGYGFMEEYEIARWYRDVAVLPIFAGTNEIMKVIIADNMGL